MLTFALLLITLFAQGDVRNYGYTPDPKPTEGFVRKMQERRQAEREQQDVDAVVEYLRTRPRQVSTQPVSFRLSPSFAFALLTLAGGVGLSVIAIGKCQIATNTTEGILLGLLCHIVGVGVCLAGFALAT